MAVGYAQPALLIQLAWMLRSAVLQGFASVRPGLLTAGLRAAAELAVALALWTVALRCRFDAYCEALRRLDERPSREA